MSGQRVLHNKIANVSDNLIELLQYNSAWVKVKKEMFKKEGKK